MTLRIGINRQKVYTEYYIKTFKFQSWKKEAKVKDMNRILSKKWRVSILKRPFKGCLVLRFCVNSNNFKWDIGISLIRNKGNK